MDIETSLTINQLVSTINQLKLEVSRLKAQQTVGRTLWNSTLIEPRITEPKISDPTNSGETTFEDDVRFVKGNNDITFAKTDGSSEITISGATVLDDVLTIKGSAADGSPTTITGTVDTDEITVSGDFNCTVGKFAASSVYVGDQKISETGGGLIITNTAIPYIYLKDEGNAVAAAECYIKFLDKNDAVISYLTGYQGLTQLVAANNSHLHLTSVSGSVFLNASNAWQVVVQDGKFTPYTDSDIDLGDSTHEFKDLYIDGIIYADQINAHGQVNFANGTTYKVESDGDAYFKQIYGTDVDISGTLTIGGVITGDDVNLTISAATYVAIQSAAAQSQYFICGNRFYWQDIDDSNAELMRLDTNARSFSIGTAADNLTIYTNGTQGVSGTFDDKDGNTVTVMNGLITDFGV